MMWVQSAGGAGDGFWWLLPFVFGSVVAVIDCSFSIGNRQRVPIQEKNENWILKTKDLEN
jgi:hypothetical protein